MGERSKTIIVIGGGAIGVCSAYYLHQKGYRVILLEKDTIAAGSSFGNAGFITPSHFIPLPSPGIIKKGLRWMLNPESPFYIKPRADRDLLSWLWKFRGYATSEHLHKTMRYLRDINLASRELYRKIAMETELDFGLQTLGLLMLYTTEVGAKECHEMATLAREIDEPAELLEPQQIHKLDPGLENRAAGGLYFPNDAHLNPAAFVTGLAEYLQKRGVEVYTGTPVTDFVIENHTVVGVKTPEKDYRCDEVILANGAWAPLLSKKLGIHLPIQPAKGYSVTIPQPANRQKIPLILTEAKVAITPLGDSIRFGGTLELSGIDSQINPRRVNAILKAVPRYIGQFDQLQVDPMTAWSGMRPCTPDGLPIISRTSKISNLIIAAGHAMIGISLAPFTGELVARIVSGEASPSEIAPLRLERFA